MSCNPTATNSDGSNIQTTVDQKKERTLTEITVSGSGYELGFQHGSQLKSEIAEIVSKWKENTSFALERDADEALSEFMEYANFDEAIKEWSPELYEEVRGIADGSEQAFNNIFVLNLLDEFWVYVGDPENHHCSNLGIPANNGNPAIVAQNMDIEGYTDGYQTVMRLKKNEMHPEQLILTHPGLIALNGLNENGTGVVVNTIMQLKASNQGLPVAFVVRKILSLSDKEEIVAFITTVPHASGQSYIIGVADEVINYEASAGKVVPHDPRNPNGTVYHTNHPIINDNLKPWFAEFNPVADPQALPVNSNSYIRLEAVKSRVVDKENITVDEIMEVLRSKDDPANPVCRNWTPTSGFTFASTIMKLGENPELFITAGPPDESEYKNIAVKQ